MSYEAPVLEHVARVLLALVTGGLPAEYVRILGLADPYTHLRESLLTVRGLGVLLILSAPTLLLVPRARSRFLFFWLAAGTLPLLLPVGTPESYHLLGTLPALFMLWGEGMDRWR